MESKCNFFLDKRAILGIIITLAGVLLLASNMGWLDYHLSKLIFSWPMLLITLGIINFFKKGHLGLGIVLLSLGVFFIIPKMPWFDISHNYYHLFWAFILVAIGLVFIFKSSKNESWAHKAEKFSVDYIDDINVFGGSEKKMSTQSFRGGKITSVFGGSNYDMLGCKLAKGKNVLDMINIFGGSKIIVPNNWKIHVEVVSIFGGFTDKRRVVNSDPDCSDCELFITGVAIFGGGEIKSI